MLIVCALRTAGSEGQTWLGHLPYQLPWLSRLHSPYCRWWFSRRRKIVLQYSSRWSAAADWEDGAGGFCVTRRLKEVTEESDFFDILSKCNEFLTYYCAFWKTTVLHSFWQGHQCRWRRVLMEGRMRIREGIGRASLRVWDRCNGVFSSNIKLQSSCCPFSASFASTSRHVLILIASLKCVKCVFRRSCCSVRALILLRERYSGRKVPFAVLSEEIRPRGGHDLR